MEGSREPIRLGVVQGNRRRERTARGELVSFGRHAKTRFEIAGEVGGLLVAEIVGDGFDAGSVFEHDAGLFEAEIAEPVGKGDVVMLAKVALQGADRNLAELRETINAKVRAEGE